MHDIFVWLDTPPSPSATDELAFLQNHAKTLRSSDLTPDERASALTRLLARSMATANTLTPKFSSNSLPISRKARQLVRALEDLLQSLASDLATLAPHLDKAKADASLQCDQAAVLWNSLKALSQHLLISNLVAAPAGTGIWLQLHQTYETARQLRLTEAVPNNETQSLQQIYYSANLLGCAQPASLTSAEVAFVATNLALFASQIDLINESSANAPEAFWIDPSKDSPAIACARKPAPPETTVHYFSCARITETLRRLLCAVESGRQTPELNALTFAHTHAGRGILRRLITNWGEPGKRRFTRRRQSGRANLCAGLDCLWQLFHDDAKSNIETSSWMITNESPDGYAIMHLSGNVDDITVGNICAVRAESEEEWKVGIIRWAQSENQEHLELGVQILATHAIPAFLAQPELGGNSHDHPSVLVLPGTPPLRSTEMLVTPSGTVPNQPKNLILVVEKENLGIREVINTRLHEQNSQIEVFAIVAGDPTD